MGTAATRIGVKLALDNHYSPEIANQLRLRGHDVLAVLPRGWDTVDDEPLLELCAHEERALMSNNVGDFVTIARQWAVEGRSHFGLVFTSDSSFPRNRASIGRFVDALDKLMSDTSEGLLDRIVWLQRTE